MSLSTQHSAAAPILYSFRRCPYAIRARLALHYAGIRCELREVLLGDKPDGLLEVSPKATVPVLVLNSGAAEQKVIEESLDVMYWALGQSDPDGWLDIDPIDVADLIDANDNEFKFWLDRYKYPNHYEGTDAADARAHCERFLKLLEGRLSGQNFLAGERESMADMALYPFVRQFAFVDKDWFIASPYQVVRIWLDGFLDSGLFQAVMKKYPAWQAGEQGEVF